MKFPEKLKAIFGKNNLVEKAKNQEMTAADWAAVSSAYEAEYGVTMWTEQEAYVAEQRAQTASNDAAAANAQVLEILNAALAEVQPQASSEPTPTPPTGSVGNAAVIAAGTIAMALREMAAQPLPDNAPSIGNAGPLSVNGPGHTPQYFCGIEHPLFSMDKRYNRIAINPAIATTEEVKEDVDGPAFRTDLRGYASQVSERMNVLRSNNMLNPQLLESGIAIGIASDGLGDQYLTRRMDMLIARLAAIRNIYHIFPRRFGVQDREAMVNAFLGDFSQAYQSGAVFKGNVNLDPEICYVDDAMLKTKFDSMKDMERQYIGYLNTSGSDPVKWSLIEWVMLQVSSKLISEQNERKMLGVYVKPEKDKPGHKLNAGTGVFYTLLRYYNEGKMALMDNPAYRSYSSGTLMVGVVTAMLDELSGAAVDGIDEFEVILNANHKAMWKQGIREIYGKDTDFTGPAGDTVPDHTNKIQWAPYLGTMPIVIIQQPGNIMCLELQVGEMHRLQFQSEMEEVKVWSNWKEGTSANYVGKRFETKLARKNNGYADQVIFTNMPAVTVEADATTVNVVGSIRRYLTAANTAATTITDIVGAKEGVAYQIELGAIANASKIAKTGKFANITDAFTPTTVGDYLLVILNSDESEFLELERCVGGTRKINVALQPNVPGGRK